MPAPVATQEIGGRSEGGWHWWREFVFAVLAFGLREDSRIQVRLSHQGAALARISQKQSGLPRPVVVN